MSTDQTGANTQIDINHSTTFNFTVLSNQNVTQVTGDFVIKKGPNTTEAIILGVFQGADAVGALIKSTAVSAASVTQSYLSTRFLITGLNLGTGYYSIKLMSATPDKGSTQYFFKNGNLVVTPNTVAVPNIVPLPPPSVVVPEPVTLLPALVAVVGNLAFLRRRLRSEKMPA